MFAIRVERAYVIEEDFMKAVRKIAEVKKLEGKLEYGQGTHIATQHRHGTGLERGRMGAREAGCSHQMLLFGCCSRTQRRSNRRIPSLSAAALLLRLFSRSLAFPVLAGRVVFSSILLLKCIQTSAVELFVAAGTRSG
jgi:hypothetical protein